MLRIKGWKGPHAWNALQHAACIPRPRRRAVLGADLTEPLSTGCVIVRRRLSAPHAVQSPKRMTLRNRYGAGRCGSIRQWFAPLARYSRRTSAEIGKRSNEIPARVPIVRSARRSLTRAPGVDGPSGAPNSSARYNNARRAIYVRRARPRESFSGRGYAPSMSEWNPEAGRKRPAITRPV